MVGTLVLVITLLSVAPTHQTGHFTFATFYKVGMPEITSGITNNGYATMLLYTCSAVLAVSLTFDTSAGLDVKQQFHPQLAVSSAAFFSQPACL